MRLMGPDNYAETLKKLLTFTQAKFVSLAEVVADMVRTDVHTEGVVTSVDNHFRAVPFGNVLLEGGVVSFYAGT